MADLLPHMGILDIQVVVPGLDLVDGNLPRLFRFDPGGKAVFLLPPPVDFSLELLETDGLGLVVALHARRIGMLVVPDMFRRLPFGEEKEVRFDARIGVEDAVGEADDRMEVAFRQ